MFHPTQRLFSEFKFIQEVSSSFTEFTCIVFLDKQYVIPSFYPEQAAKNQTYIYHKLVPTFTCINESFNIKRSKSQV